MLVVIVRVIVLYLLVVTATRVMGKRQIGELQPYELAIAVMISDLASIPMQDIGIPLLNGIIPILILLVLQVLFSFMTLKNEKLRAIICGKPRILIANGKLNESNMRKELYNLNDLLEQLRINNTPNISDVEFAILETSGQLSVIPKSQKRPVTPKDLNIPTEYEGLPLDIIIDGIIDIGNLDIAGLDENWLRLELHKNGINTIQDVLFASLDTNGNLYVQRKISGRRKNK